MPANRRTFLKIGALGLGATGLSGATTAWWGLDARANPNPGTDGDKVIPTFCELCFWKCGVLAHVKDGKVTKLVGNPQHPLSQGKLCPRGVGGTGQLYDPDRLKKPLIRVGKRGEERFEEVSWEVALDKVAEGMDNLRKKYGPQSLALFSHGFGGTWFSTLVKAYGTQSIGQPSFAQCRGPREAGYALTFGSGLGSPEPIDIANAKVITLIGAHLGENMHNTQVQEFATAVGRGASVIVVDPRFSVAASKAKFYLPIKPGTDLALVLAWMNVLVTEKLYDAAYVNEHGFGFEQFAASITGYTPEWAYPETGIDPDTIRATAREMARYRPATLVHPGRHVNWNGDDAQRSRAIALLNALLGSWGRKGGFYTPSSMDMPDYPYPAYPKPAKPKVDNPDHKYPFAHEAITTGIRDATLTGKPYPIKGWMVYATNLLHALPNEAETIRAIQQLDLLVVVDVIPSEIAGWADVVLPESTYLERHDELNVELFKEPFVALRQPVLDSPDDQKPNWWIAKKLAEKLGLAAFYPWKNIEEYLEHRITEAGLDFAELKKNGIIRGERQPIYFEEGVPAEFGTPSGKIEFYSAQLAKAGFDPVPKYTPPVASPPGAFRLLFGRAPVHSFSRTHTNRLLSDMMDENAVWVNADIAQRAGLKSGDLVRLKNQDGILSNRVKVKATERIRPDCVYLVHGFGHTARGMRHAYGKGASDAQMITRYKTDPLMGGTAMNVNFVTLEAET